MNRLLIVDDEPDVVEGLTHLFRGDESLDLDVLCAYSGTQALAAMEKKRIDVLLCDIRMPGMTGLELFARVRLEWPGCQVIFLTGHTDFDAIYTATRNGAASYLLKTESREKILEAVTQAIIRRDEAHQADEMTARFNDYAARARSFANREVLSALWLNQLDQAASLRGIAQLDGGLGGSFSADAPMMVVAAQINRASDQPVGRDRLFLALDEMAGSYLGPDVRRAVARTQRHMGVALFQGDGLHLLRLQGALEAVQSTLTLDWHADIAIALHPSAVAAPRIGEVLANLMPLLEQRLSFGAGILVARDGDAPESAMTEARAITMIKEYVHAHLSEALSLPLLASLVFLNPSYLSRLFRRETGVTLIGYINAVRIEKAMELLSRTNMRISAIAAQVGLESPSYFHQVFRRHCGVSPQEYRQQKVK